MWRSLIIAGIIFLLRRGAVTVAAEDVAAILKSLERIDHKQGEEEYRRYIELSNAPVAQLQEALPAIVDLYDRQPSFTMHVFNRFRDRGGNLTPAVPKLVGFLGSTDIFSKCDLILLLGDLGPAAGEGIPKLKELLRTEGHLGHFFGPRAASALARIDPNNPDYIDYLISCLTADEALLRWLAADSLGRVGPGAARATAHLIKAREDEDPAVRMYAASALWRITHRSELSLRTLVRALEEPGSPANLEPLGTLTEALPHHLIAATFFGRMGVGAFEALPELLARFYHLQPDHFDELVRRSLLLGINRIAPFDPRVCQVTLETAFGLHPPLQTWAWYILITSPARTFG